MRPLELAQPPKPLALTQHHQTVIVSSAISCQLSECRLQKKIELKKNASSCRCSMTDTSLNSLGLKKSRYLLRQAADRSHARVNACSLSTCWSRLARSVTELLHTIPDLSTPGRLLKVIKSRILHMSFNELVRGASGICFPPSKNPRTRDRRFVF